MKTIRVAIVQTNAGDRLDENLQKLDDLLADIPSVDLIALPEVFAIRGSHDDYRRVAAPLDGPTLSRLTGMAKEKDAWLLAGSVIEAQGDHIYNTSVLLDRSGKLSAAYRKIHLFEAHLDNGQTIRESDAYEAGDQPVLADIEGWRAGLAICYDLRFPELFRQYASQGANILFVPSNFTQRTGKDHWEILVRARAIENQCFVVAPNQCGRNPATNVASHGHSMAVGPWGEVICRAGDEEEVLIAELDPAEIETTRGRIPALQHRRL